MRCGRCLVLYRCKAGCGGSWANVRFERKGVTILGCGRGARVGVLGAEVVVDICVGCTGTTLGGVAGIVAIGGATLGVVAGVGVGAATLGGGTGVSGSTTGTLGGGPGFVAGTGRARMGSGSGLVVAGTVVMIS